MRNKPRIALITTWFPPKNGVAVNRMSAFAKYLADDFEIEIFTEGASQPGQEGFKVHYIASHSFLNNLKHQTTDSWLRHNLISAVNVAKGITGYSTLKKWKKEVVNVLVEKHRQNPFDLIISSYAPIEPHLAALEFVKQNHIPWIADMRDEMSKNPTITPAEKNRFQQVEKEINQYATAITTVSAPILQDFKKLMPTVKVFKEIRNGFDHEIPPRKVENTVFTVGYVGRFYGEISPKTFFEAWLNLKRQKKIELKVKMVGTFKTFQIPKELNDDIEFIEPVSYLKAIEMMNAMNANLLVHPSGKRKGVYTGKLFDYISVGKPVIGIIDKEDVAAKLIRKMDCGYIADFYDVDEIESILLQAYSDWKNGIVKRATDEEISMLHRKNDVKKMAKLVKELIAQ